MFRLKIVEQPPAWNSEYRTKVVLVQPIIWRYKVLFWKVLSTVTWRSKSITVYLYIYIYFYIYPHPNFTKWFYENYYTWVDDLWFYIHFAEIPFPYGDFNILQSILYLSFKKNFLRVAR